MGKSIESRLEALRHAFAEQNPGEVVVTVDLVTAENRDEAAALLGLPTVVPPTAGKSSVIRLSARHVSAQAYLAEQGIEPQQPEAAS